MIIKKLDHTHTDALGPLFSVRKYMGTNTTADFFEKDHMAEMYHMSFCKTYLTNLTSYHAFGAFDSQDNLVGVISCYQSTDEPAWYGTQIRSNNNKTTARKLLDHMIQFNEAADRFKFYTLWNAKHAKLLRRFTFSAWANERYDYFDECIVPAKTKCLYTNHWQILFNRILLPHDTVVRCTFLKQQYRENSMLNGGNI